MSKETTPGPWKLDEVWMLIKGPQGEEVCAIHSGDADGSQRLQRNIAHANAQLIASAPELLEALEKMEAVFLRCEEADIDLRNFNAIQFQVARKAARQAIAKARGEA